MLCLGVSSSLLRRVTVGGFLSSGFPRKISEGLESQSSAIQRVPIPTRSTSSAAASMHIQSARDDKDRFSQVGLRQELMPKHVAAILDGNRRWAKLNGKELDYSLFCQGYMNLAHLCVKWGVSTLTCFLFSTENWNPSQGTNGLLFQQFQDYLQQSLDDFMGKGIKTSIIGEKSKLPNSLQEVINQVEEATKNKSKLELNFAVNYGGKWDISNAIRSISRKAKAGEIQLEDVNEELVGQLLSTSSLRVPDPDLMIRTGGDQRISNFLMWQMSHTEFYFTDVYGPDFREPHFIDALRWFQKCDRLFGK